jgi:hypothetical protein
MPHVRKWSGGEGPIILTSTLDGGEWLASRPGCFTAEESTPVRIDRKLSGPQSRSGTLWKREKFCLAWNRTVV